VFGDENNGSFDQSFGTNGLVYKQSSAANAQVFSGIISAGCFGQDTYMRGCRAAISNTISLQGF